MKTPLRIASAFSLALLATAPIGTKARAAVCTARSGQFTPHLIELYTSEGCSSCPPADSWLNGLREDARVVALEFHVDYWDALGWHDPFGSAGYSARQDALGKKSRSHIVYTPEVALDGREWREWSRAPIPAPTATELPITLEVTSAKTVRARLVAEKDAPADWRITYALVESGLSSDIRAGENTGRTLKHEHVVRALAGPLPFGASAELEPPAELVTANAAVVAFATDAQANVVATIEQALNECR